MDRRKSHLHSVTSTYDRTDDDDDDDHDDDDNVHRRRILQATSSPEDYPIVAETLDWLQHVVMGLNLCPFAKPSFVLDQIRIHVLHGDNPTDILAGVLGECWKLKFLSTTGRSKEPTARPTASGGGTTLVVCPDLFPNDFYQYLELYNILQEGVLVDQNLTGVLQVAPFHPLFEFAVSDVADPEMENIMDDPDSDDESATPSATAVSNRPYDDNNNNDDDDDEGMDLVTTGTASASEVDIDNYTNRSPYPMFHILREEEVSKAVDALDGDASKVWKRNMDLLQALQEEFSEQRDDHLLRSTILLGKRRGDSGNEYRRRVQKVLKLFRKRE
jgi:hypothetical protein